MSRERPNSPAGPAFGLAKREFNAGTPEALARRKAIQEQAAYMYGIGMPRARIARIMLDLLVPHRTDRPMDQRLSQARNKLKKWEMSQPFRDMVHRNAVVALDMAGPAILKGIGRKAKRGRVDAARLALELTGRHNPKGDQTPTTVQVVFAGVPWPGQAALPTADVDGEAVEAEEE